MEGMSYSTLRELGCGGSFSFSCSDSDLNFSSALSHFTDEVGDDVGEDDSDVDDEESYIEIELDHHHHHHPKGAHDDDCAGERLDHVDYLRISFSSSFPFPDFSNPNTQDDTNVVDSETTTDQATEVNQAASSSSTTPTTSVEDFGGSDRDVRTTKKRSKLPAVNRLVNTLFFSLWSSSSDTTAKKAASGIEDDYSIRLPPSHVDNDDFVQTRKISTVKTTVNGGIMKLFFKFRAMNLGTLVASFVKPRKVVCPPDQEYYHFSYGVRKKKKSIAQSSLQPQKPLDKFFVRKKQQKKCVKMENSSRVVGGGEKSRVLEKNLNVVRGVLEAIGNSMSTGVNRKERRTRSCPSSIRSSPIHKEFAGDQSKIFARETSIQAAIAHCKFSLEQLS